MSLHLQASDCINKSCPAFGKAVHANKTLQRTMYVKYEPNEFYVLCLDFLISFFDQPNLQLHTVTIQVITILFKRRNNNSLFLLELFPSCRRVFLHVCSGSLQSQCSRRTGSRPVSAWPVQGGSASPCRQPELPPCQAAGYRGHWAKGKQGHTAGVMCQPVSP